MKSKAMKDLETELSVATKEAREIQDKKDATAEAITAKTDALKAVKARIAAQEQLDDGKNFDEDGDEIKDTNPVNKPVHVVVNETRPFKSFGEQLVAIKNAAKAGATVDERLLKVQNASGANEGVASEGGFLVQQDFIEAIEKIMFAPSNILSLCRPIPISGSANSVKLNGVDETSRATGSRWGGVRAYWADEAESVNASKPKFKKIELSLNKLMALYYATDELLADSSAMESILTQSFGEEVQFVAVDALIRGTGAGQMLGFKNSGCYIQQAKETNQAADTVVSENISKMWNRMLPSSRSRAVWLINHEVEPQLDALSFAIGTGGTISPLAMEYLTKGTIKGRPVMVMEQCDALGDVGDINLVDPGMYYLATKGGMKFASSMHVQFLTDEMTFRVTYRVDGKPALDSAITPYKGSATLSPFVGLAARA